MSRKPYRFPVKMKRSETAREIKGFRAKAKWQTQARYRKAKKGGKRQ